MRFALAALFIAFSSYAFSQGTSLAVEQSYLSDSARMSVGKAAEKKTRLNRSLANSLGPKIVRSSDPYTITNMPEMMQAIQNESSQFQPNLNLLLSMFRKSEALDIAIDTIDNIRGRSILRGKVRGAENSSVKLVFYDGQMSGRIFLSSKPRVYVIRSIEDGITANYEIDTSNIQYD